MIAFCDRRCAVWGGQHYKMTEKPNVKLTDTKCPDCGGDLIWRKPRTKPGAVNEEVIRQVKMLKAQHPQLNHTNLGKLATPKLSHNTIGKILGGQHGCS